VATTSPVLDESVLRGLLNPEDVPAVLSALVAETGCIA
jgi:hypothetical protein